MTGVRCVIMYLQILYVRSYKHGYGAKLWGYERQFLYRENLY